MQRYAYSNKASPAALESTMPKVTWHWDLTFGGGWPRWQLHTLTFGVGYPNAKGTLALDLNLWRWNPYFWRWNHITFGVGSLLVALGPQIQCHILALNALWAESPQPPQIATDTPESPQPSQIATKCPRKPATTANSNRVPHPEGLKCQILALDSFGVGSILLALDFDFWRWICNKILAML